MWNSDTDRVQGASMVLGIVIFLLFFAVPGYMVLRLAFHRLPSDTAGYKKAGWAMLQTAVTLVFGGWLALGLDSAVGIPIEMILCPTLLFLPWYPVRACMREDSSLVRKLMKATLPVGFFLGMLPGILEEREREYVVRSAESGEFGSLSRSSVVPEFTEKPDRSIGADFPRIDGATALNGLFTRMAMTLYGMNEEEVQRHVSASTTPKAYQRLIAGDCDMVCAAYPSVVELTWAEAGGAPLRLTPIGREAFVFIVNADNPVDSVSVEQLKKVYSGAITNWKDLGGPDREIVAYQRNKNSGSQSRMERFMGDVELAAPPMERIRGGMGGMLTFVARYHNHQNAIGYSFRYYVDEMMKMAEIKTLQIDGVYPDLETIRSGAYPLVEEIYLVTTEKSNPQTELILDWMRSAQGQRLVRASGYVPLFEAE